MAENDIRINAISFESFCRMLHIYEYALLKHEPY